MEGAKITVGGKIPTSLEELLGKLFWKDPELVPIAFDFLNYIKEWGRSENPYRVSQWESYCTRRGITQSQYHNILRRLKRAGMIEKKYNKAKGYHELFISKKFSEDLEGMRKAWDTFRES